jgi:hypothetical protein
VVELAVDAQGDAAGVVDAVVADAVVGVHPGCGGGGFGSGLVGGGRGGSVLEGAVRAVVVVAVSVGVEKCLEGGEVAGGWGWARSHFFMVCWNRSTLPQVVGCPGVEFFWVIASRASSASRPLRPLRPPASRAARPSGMS